jgi:hypothetical protein
VKQTVRKRGYCVIVASEGAHYADGTFLADAGATDAFGHKQLGGVAPTLAAMIKEELGYKYHWALADYLQRAARHIASRTDVEQAYAVGKAAVEYALAGPQRDHGDHRARSGANATRGAPARRPSTASPTSSTRFRAISSRPTASASRRRHAPTSSR